MRRIQDRRSRVVISAVFVGLFEPNSVRCEILSDAFVHAASFLDGSSCMVCRRLGPIAGIAGFDGPFSELGEVTVLNLNPPAFGQEVPQRVQVVSERERNLL